jgi:hypothetical protein
LFGLGVTLDLLAATLVASSGHLGPLAGRGVVRGRVLLLDLMLLVLVLVLRVLLLLMNYVIHGAMRD